MTLGPNLTTTEARTAPQTPDKPPLPTDLAGLKLEVIRKRVEWGRVRRSGGGTIASLTAMMMWLLARLNTLLPMRAFAALRPPAWPADECRHRVPDVLLRHGPLGHRACPWPVSSSADHPALLDQVIKSVALTAPGLLQVDGSEGLVDPYELLNPTSLGWAAGIAAVVTVFTSLGWVSGIRDGVRGMMQLGPLGMNPVLQILKDVGTLVLIGVTLVISAAVSLVFGTAAGLGDRAAGPRSDCWPGP